LGEVYSRLYWTLGRGPFGLGDTERILGLSRPKIFVAFSKLHSLGGLIVFDRGRPRRYRLLDPRSLTLRMSGEVLDPGFRQEQYLQLAFDTFLSLRSRISLVSFCVFGSVARGVAGPSSDLDVLAISDEFRGSLASRIDLLSFVDEEVKDETAFLRGEGLTPWVSIIPLRREEAEAEPILLLDPSSNAKLLYDREGFLSEVLGRFRAKLELAGSRRVETKEGWYWDLKPDYRQGQEEVLA
jgi:hypothetical protein